MSGEISIRVHRIEPPEGCNIILGQSHFIKTVEDLYEALANSVPGIRFGIAFCESSGPCLVRHEGTDEELRSLAIRIASELAAGHCFVVLMRGAFPINVMDKVKAVPEVCAIYCATANPLEVIIAESAQGRGILGVIDGYRTKGVEGAGEVRERKELLRKLKYKL